VRLPTRSARLYAPLRTTLAAARFRHPAPAPGI